MSQLPSDRKISKEKAIEVTQNSSVLRNYEMACFARELAEVQPIRRWERRTNGVKKPENVG